MSSRGNISARMKAVDWPLLLFIIGVTNVKLYIKFAAVILYLIYFLYKRYTLRAHATGIIAFYLLMPLAGLVGALFHSSFGDANYKYTYFLGAGIWLLAAAVSWLLYLSARRLSYETLSASLKAFFAINFVVSLCQLLLIMLSAHSIMPYWFNDAAGQYGISTGDYIRGLTGSASVVNSVIATLGLLFFYFRRQWWWTALCLLTMTLCTSNLTLLCLLLVLIVMLIFAGGKGRRPGTFLLFVTTIAVYAFVSPRNIVYISTIFEKVFFPRPHGALTNLERYYKTHRAAFFKMDVKDSAYADYARQITWLDEQSANDTRARHSRHSTYAMNEAISKWYGIPADSTPLHFVNSPGKLYAFKQSVFYLSSQPENIAVGAGMGNFSSKLALKASGLGLEGAYPERMRYISLDFFNYHLYGILYYFSRPESEHSVMNMPDNTYDQLAAEYGLPGILLFLLCYMGYFRRHRKHISHSRYLILITLLFLGYGYWFEMISLTVFFELLMFMDIFASERNNGHSPAPDNGINAGL